MFEPSNIFSYQQNLLICDITLKSILFDASLMGKHSGLRGGKVQHVGDGNQSPFFGFVVGLIEIERNQTSTVHRHLAISHVIYSLGNIGSHIIYTLLLL